MVCQVYDSPSIKSCLTSTGSVGSTYVSCSACKLQKRFYSTKINYILAARRNIVLGDETLSKKWRSQRTDYSRFLVRSLALTVPIPMYSGTYIPVPEKISNYMFPCACGRICNCFHNFFLWLRIVFQHETCCNLATLNRTAKTGGGGVVVVRNVPIWWPWV
jgi:hypothetical protein